MMEPNDLQERAFIKLLERATRPEPPPGSHERLLRRIGDSAAQGSVNVIPLRRQDARPARRAIAFALPLAASLLLGILVGSDTLLDNFLPESIVSFVQPVDFDFDMPEPFGDADTLEGDLA